MKVVYKIWFENEGKAFGDGPYLLLKGIEKTGSLHQAALGMEMSYQKAWNIINASEKRLGFNIIERRVGGASGGGSNLTDSGKVFMNKYEQFKEDIHIAVEEIYRKHFG